MLNHEYALLGGINRAFIGRYIGAAASIISGIIVFLLLSLVDLASTFGVAVNLPPTALSLVGAGVVFSVLYMLFDKFVWRWSLATKWLKVADLSGEWTCNGKTLSESGEVRYEWSADVTICQTWDKIRVRLKTSQSGSNSIAAALLYDEAEGYRLLYNYRNDPRADQPELRSHVGCANVLFDKNLLVGSGEYFNGHGRPTFGRMEFTRKAPAAVEKV